MAGRDATERRAYILPIELLDRLRRYQAAQGINSEVEAVRRLLDLALQMRDDVKAILNTLGSLFKEEHDLRVLAREALISHALVQDINISDNHVEFRLRDGSRGRIDAKGDLWKADPGEEYFEEYRVKGYAAVASKTEQVSSWDAPRGGGNLDDEIPF